jgi:hypothetical protein
VEDEMDNLLFEVLRQLPNNKAAEDLLTSGTLGARIPRAVAPKIASAVRSKPPTEDLLGSLSREVIGAVATMERLLDMSRLSRTRILELAGAGRLPANIANIDLGEAVPVEEDDGIVIGEELSCQKLAVCAGITAYRQNPLDSPAKDAIAFRGKLISEFGFMGQNIALFTDDEATKDGIMSALKNAVGRLKAGDVFVFYFSGHGTQTADRNFEEPDLLDEALVPYDAVTITELVRSNLIVDDELRTLFDAVPGDRNVCVVLDSCHSGTALKLALPGKVKAFPPSQHVRNLIDEGLGVDRVKHTFLTATQNHVLLAACAAQETALDGGPPNSLYTRHLLNAMRKDRTYQEIHNAAAGIVVNASGKRQTPQIEGRGSGRKAFECILSF